MASRSARGTSAKLASIVRHELGQSLPPWGKSLDHISRSTPMRCRLAMAYWSVMYVKENRSSMYSLGSLANLAFAPVARRRQRLSICSFMYGTHPASTSTNTMGSAGHAVEHARIEELDQHRHRLHEPQVAGGPAGGHAAGRVRVHREFVDQPDMDVQGQPGLGQGMEHLIVLVDQIDVAVGITAHEGPGHAGAVPYPLDLGQGLIDATVREQHDGAQSGRLEGAVVDEPVVVGLDHGQVELGILIGDDDVRQAGRRIEDGGIDQILVELLEPLGGLIARRPGCPRSGPRGRDRTAGASPRR